MIIVMAILDMIGVASILPFMAVLSNPSIIESNAILKTLFQISKNFGVETNNEFLFFLGMNVFLLLIFSLSFKAITTYSQLRFLYMREYSIGKRLIEGYLHQPYSWFLTQNSADLGKNILSEVANIITNGMYPLLELIAKSILVITLITLLFFIDPKLTLVVGLTLIFVYMLIFYFAKTFLAKIGKDRLKNNQLRFTSVSEAFGAAKEVKIGGLESVYIKSFSNAAQIYARTIASSQVVAQLPRFILEIIAFGGILLIILYLIIKTGAFNNSLPIISLYVFAGYRLMPSIQVIYNSISKLTFVSSAVDQLYIDLKSLNFKHQLQDKKNITLNKAIVLNNVHYNYPNSNRTALKDINLTISANSTVGIIGQTGCGKTTTVDIILGLLEPQKGKLEVDGKLITEQNLRSWQRLIGYVPQNIYLSDDTIMANIAFGVELKNINQDTVKKVSKIANIHHFINDELPQKYKTVVGERGVRLSGGQRQRIGIARALYHNPRVLILDEATSSLDDQTEKAVMDSVYNLHKSLTIILIAHRLGTVKKCDKLFLLNKGMLKSEGKFEELINFDENFQINNTNNN